MTRGRDDEGMRKVGAPMEEAPAVPGPSAVPIAARPRAAGMTAGWGKGSFPMVGKFWDVFGKQKGQNGK